MPRLVVCAAALVAALATHAARAQEPMPPSASERPAEPVDYEKELRLRYYEETLRRYDDPWAAVRRKAEFRAAQRQRRIAAMKWYGYSAARPTANPTPWGASYGATWTNSQIRVGSWAAGGRALYLPRR